MFKVAVLFIVVAVGFSLSEAKVFSKCEFAQQLLKYGVPKSQIPTFTCIAQHESGLDSTKINHSNGNHGILQISETRWCNAHGGPRKACKKTCADFRDDNLHDDIECAKTMYARYQRLVGNGFMAWTVYKNHCLGNTSQYIKGCF